MCSPHSPANSSDDRILQSRYFSDMQFIALLLNSLCRSVKSYKKLDTAHRKMSSHLITVSYTENFSLDSSMCVVRNY